MLRLTPPPSDSVFLSYILATAHLLSDACHLIHVNRSARSRHTRLHRCLARMALPLRSLVARLDRGLVCVSAASYTAFALATLRRFESDLLRLFRSLGNSARRTPALAALVEQTVEAVALVEEKERTLALNTQCCA